MVEQPIGQLNTFDADVIIIGAGVSGLAAAREFKEKGVSYLIVEGGNRVGGRMCSMQWQGTTIELGANWVTGCVSSNPIYRIAVEQLGLEGSVDERETDQFDYIDCVTGKDFTEQGRESYEKFNQYFLELYRLRDQTIRGGSLKYSVANALEDVGWKRPATSSFDAAAEWLYIDFELGCSGDFASFANMHYDYTTDHFTETEYIVQDQRGFSSLTDQMYSQIDADRVILGQIIETIDTNGGAVTIKTQTGHSYTCKSLLITVSVGVLKAGTIKFNPELPAWKTKAIANTSMASYTKVFVQWEKRWWDDLAENPESAHKRNLFTVLLDEGDEQSKWRLVNDLLPLGKHPKSDDPQSRTLVFTSVGQESLRVQSLSESELKSELMVKLGRAFPQHSVPEPKAIYSPKWDHDPLFRGAYSVVEATDTVDADSDLRAPILQDGHGAIHFAGEAMHAFYKGYLSTAYLSGQEEA